MGGRAFNIASNKVLILFYDSPDFNIKCEKKCKKKEAKT